MFSRGWRAAHRRARATDRRVHVRVARRICLWNTGNGQCLNEVDTKSQARLSPIYTCYQTRIFIDIAYIRRATGSAVPKEVDTKSQASASVRMYCQV